MSSTPDMTFTSSNLETLLNPALTEYTERTGIGLWDHPLASKIGGRDKLESILDIFQKQAQAFDNFRKGDTKLFKWLRPVVNLLYALSANVDRNASAGLMFPLTNAVFSGILILLSNCHTVMYEVESYDFMVDIFECIENILGPLRVYTQLPLTSTVIETLIKIMLKLLSVLALGTEQINQGRFKRYAKKTFLEEMDVESVLQRLDRLTLDGSGITVAQTPDVVYDLVNIMQVVMEDGKTSMDDIRPSLVPMQNLVPQLNEVKRDQLQENFRRWLSPPNPWVNHNTAREAHHRGTATWFIQGDDFNDWKSEGSLLWIHGLPGSGKTVLCSSIIEDIHAIRRIGLANLVFFYFDFRDIGKQDARSLLSSFLIQLCHNSDEFSQILSSLYSVHGIGSRRPSEAALMECLKDILNLPGQANIYIVVDALDECPTNSRLPSPREQVLTIIEELINLRLPHVRFCITSRLEVDIRYVLKASAAHEVALHEQAGQNQDIFNYIQYVISSDQEIRRLEWKEEDKRLVVKTLTERGGGMFQWIVCQWKTLRHCFRISIRRALDELPESLDRTYEQSLRMIDEQKRDFAYHLFQCMVVSKRPLLVVELAELFAIQFDAETIPTFHANLRPKNPEESILSACSSLVTVVDIDRQKYVQFSHFSVGEYLTSDRIALSKHVSHFHILPRNAHGLLARACLSVLLHLDDRIDRDSIQNFPLALYAAQYWVDHAQFENVSSYIQPAIERLFDRNNPHFAAWLRLYDPFALSMTSVYVTWPYPVLYYAALCGFRDVAEHLINAHPQDLNARGGTRGTPLHAALDGRHQSVAMLLLERGANIGCLDSQRRTPLHIACRGCTNVVSVLINRGVDLNAVDDSRETPLHVASQGGHDDIIRLLLDHDADADRLDVGARSPLHVASHEGHYKIVQLLFDHGADANRPDNDGWTPLHLASWEGHEHVVRVLLDHGINANHPDNGGWTPLHVASHEGHNHIVKLLLDHGADPNHSNSHDPTPLHVALQRNHDDTVQLLFDHGGDPDYANSDGSTLLHLASQRGHVNTVRLLLNYGADANRLNGDGWASLHLASQRGHYDVVRLLLEHGADSNHAHSDGLTPLHLASQEGHDDIVLLLLDRGADANSLNSGGWTPLDLASQKGHDHIVLLLLEYGADHPNTGGLTPTARDFASGEGVVERKPPEGVAIATRTRRRA